MKGREWEFDQCVFLSEDSLGKAGLLGEPGCFSGGKKSTRWSPCCWSPPLSTYCLSAVLTCKILQKINACRLICQRAETDHCPSLRCWLMAQKKVFLFSISQPLSPTPTPFTRSFFYSIIKGGKNLLKGGWGPKERLSQEILWIFSCFSFLFSCTKTHNSSFNFFLNL